MTEIVGWYDADDGAKWVESHCRSQAVDSQKDKPRLVFTKSCSR